MAGVVPTLGFIISAAYFSGQILSEFKTVTNNQIELHGDVKELKTKVDTLQAQQIAQYYKQQLQNQAIWDAISRRNNENRTFIREQYKQGRNGPLTLTQVH